MAKQDKQAPTEGNEIKTAADLKQDGNNYRKHSDTNKARIKKSIDEACLGRSVVVDADGVLIAGNGVQQVVDPETPVRVIETDGTELVVVKRTDLHTDDPRRKTLALADNATSDNVEWDFDAMEADGWDEEAVAEFGVEWTEDEEEGKQQEAKEDDFDIDKPVETVCKKGDIWKLGNHRLMCGDSTDAGSVALLMDGKKADMCFTDPPYGVSIGSKNAVLNSVQKAGRCCENIENDTLNPDELRDVLVKCMTNARENCKDDASYFVTAPQGGGIGMMMMMMMMMDAGLEVRHVLMWVKNAPTFSLGRLDYDYQHEPIFYTWTKSHHNYRAGKFRSSVWTFDKPRKCDLHPTMKPIGLVSNCLIDTTKEGDSVIDVFGGSGTTLIAAEQLNRKCYMMELDPHYCDVIIARWEKLTGKNAEKLK